jgi:SAM-dependent methyltransferase
MNTLTATAAPCPCCGSTQTEAFFRIAQAPIFSLVTMKSREQALAVPRKDIELAFCHGCGFVFNHLFDTSIDYFTLGYEDQQGFSKTFMAYLTRISQDLIERHQLQGKTLMEIGCGKGDFINLLCELAQAHGIGVDPAYEDGRQTNPRLSFHKAFYAPEHGQLGADFICCRHTLEHIHATRDFLQLIRDAIPEGQRPVLFFEVPEISRILDVPAFWDIYYEHCSYFSAGSMAALFRRTGFDVTAARLDYSDQYLLLEAAPANAARAPTEARLTLEESVEHQWARAQRFKQRVAAQLGQWRERLTAMKQAGKKVVVWGGGSKSVGFLTNFADLQLIDYVVDINPHMENNFIPGIGSQYVQPPFLATLQPDAVIIMNGVYEKEITASLHAMGVRPEVFAL